MAPPRIPDDLRRLLPPDVDPARVTHFVHLEAGYGQGRSDTVVLLEGGRLRVLRSALVEQPLAGAPRLLKEGFSHRLCLPGAGGRDEVIEVSSLRASDLQALLEAAPASSAPPAPTADRAPPRSSPPPDEGRAPEVSTAPPLGPAGREAELRRGLARAPDDGELLRGLWQVYAETGRVDPAWCVSSVLALQGRAGAQERSFFERYRRPDLARASRRLSARAFERWVGAPEESPHLSAIFGLIAPLLVPAIACHRRPLGLSRRHRRDLATDTLLVSRLVGYLAEALALPVPPELYVDLEASTGLRVGVAFAPEGPAPYLVVGADLLAGVDERALGFAFARALSTLRPEHWLVHLVPTIPQLTTVFFSAVELVDRRFRSPAEIEASAEEVADLLSRSATPALLDALAVEVRALSRQGGTLDLAGWRDAVAETANRAGLVLGGDLLAAASVVAELAPPLGEAPPAAQIQALCRYAVSEEHFTARQELGLALPS